MHILIFSIDSLFFMFANRKNPGNWCMEQPHDRHKTDKWPRLDEIYGLKKSRAPESNHLYLPLSVVSGNTLEFRPNASGKI